MIMIRPGQAQKMGGKPPPPVPPRPSKTVVQEALAKSRFNIKEAAKTNSPIRQAPPPPIPELVKSKSTFSVNVQLKKPATYDRSISEETRNSSRPVIYQSSNVKCNNNNNNKVQITTRRDGDVKIVNRVDSFRGTSVQVVRRNSVKKSEDGRDPKRDSFCQEKLTEKIVEIKDSCDYERNEKNDEKTTKSNASTLEKSCDSSEKNTYESSSGHSSLDKKNWDKMLNDRNHVNTLIDEMFASVLEVQFTDEPVQEKKVEVHLESAVKPTNCLVRDKTQIIVNGVEDVVNDKRDVVVATKDAIVEEKVVPKTVIVIKNDSFVGERKGGKRETECIVSNGSASDSDDRAKQVTFKDQMNHELLINELQCMKKDQEKILKRQRKPSMNIYAGSAVSKSDKVSQILSGEEGEVKISRCQITIDDQDECKEKNGLSLDYERITKMSSLHGLPPLPKSLSGFNLPDNRHPPSGGQQQPTPPTPARSSSMRATAGPPLGHPVYPPPHAPKQNGAVKVTNLDTQLAVLRREMYSLRQLDLSLLSQLWSLNESIQDFRQILQDQEDDIVGSGRALSPPSPSLAASSTSGDDDDDEFYVSASSLNFGRPPPPPVAARRPSGSSNASSLG